MKCGKCGGKMVKWKYMNYNELEVYLLSEGKRSYSMGTYEEWLKLLHENDLVLTLLKREDYNGIKEKYYVRVVERITGRGIKLRHLTTIFNYDTGEIVYGEEDEFVPKTTYKIDPMDKEIDEIIRNYCKNEEEFDIDQLNKIITRNVVEERN